MTADLQNPIFNDLHKAREALGVDDATRAVRAIKDAEGKRLTYWRADEA